MITQKSFKASLKDHIVKRAFDFVTFDLETRDSFQQNIRDGEIISYGLCFSQMEKRSGKSILRFSLFGEILENLKEEQQLQQHILQVFSLLKETEITGHNFQLNLPCKKGWRDPHGYDFRKIRERCAYFKLDASILSQLRCYDTINIGFYHYDHRVKPRSQRDGRPKKLLRVDELEEDFHIVRPKAIPKLGAVIRSIFDDTRKDHRFSLILTYNLVDTLVEALITLIFKEQMANGTLISPKNPHPVFKAPIKIDALDVYSFIQEI